MLKTPLRLYFDIVEKLEDSTIKSLKRIGFATSRHEPIIPDEMLEAQPVVPNLKQLRKDLNLFVAPNNPKPIIINTNKKVAFPHMDRLVQLIHCNTLSQEKLALEFQIFLQSRGRLSYDPPSVTLIKKRIKQVCSYETISGKASKCWIVRPRFLIKFLKRSSLIKSGLFKTVDEINCDSWEYLLPDIKILAQQQKDKQAAYEEREKEKERKKIEREQIKKDKEKEKIAKKEKLAKEKEEKAKLIKEGREREHDKENHHGPNHPPPKRLKVDSTSGMSTPGNESGRLSPAVSLMKHLTVMTQEEKRKSIQNVNILPLRIPEKPVTPKSQKRDKDKENNDGASTPNKGFGLPTQEGIDKLFNNKK